MKYMLQVCTGSWNTLNHTPGSVIRKIREIASFLPVSQVILGWNTDVSVYQEIGAFLREAGIGMLLWLPVFSEISAVSAPDEALDIFGRSIVTPLHQEGEDFLFCCPSSRRNLQIVKDLYEDIFAPCGFDGVFLDKIRGQSFVAGVPGVLSCGCDRCRQVFQKKGVDIHAVSQAYEKGKDAFFDMLSYPLNGLFTLRNALAQQFFEAREEIIAASVSELIRFFKSRGLIVGLDLFAPLVSRFVGQRYALIAQEADFIKPMLYRRTEAPAGIGYECALFRKHVPGARGQPKICMNRAFLDSQLEAVGQVSCGKYPGIEINYREEMARTDPAYISESLSAVVDHGFDGAVLCWDIMLAPESHLRAAGAFV